LKLWETVWDLWKNRNGTVHSKESRLDKEKVLQEVEEEYSRGFVILPPLIAFGLNV